MRENIRSVSTKNNCHDHLNILYQA